ncbi:MAG: hypothetical protein WA610_01135 [Thermodesulfovibrionales bacterium]
MSAEEVKDEAGRITSVINKVIDVYGGKEVLEGIYSLHVKGETEAFMLHDQGTYELYFKRGRKLLVETRYARSTERRILIGNRGYRGTGTLPLEEVFGPRYFAMLYHYKHLDILHDLLMGTYQISSRGRSSVNGRNVEIFRLQDKEGTIMDICIDVQNFQLIKVTGYFSAENKKIDLSSEFSDFRKVGGSLFPFRVTNYAGGVKIAQTVIDKYYINPDIADSLFEPPIIHSL